MINMLKFDYTPKTACWVHGRGQAQALLAVLVFSRAWNDIAADSALEL